MNRLRKLLVPAAAFTIGLLNTTGIPALMVLSLLAPVLCASQATHARAAVAIGMYYAACTWPALVVLCNYLGLINALVFGPLICLLACCVLAAPFWAVWSRDRRQAAWMMPVAILLSAVPPLGIVGVGNPLMVSGLLFPASQWLGVFLTLALPTALLIRPRITLIAVSLTSAFLHFRPIDRQLQLQGWTGLHTMNTCTASVIECDFHFFAAVRRQAEGLTGGVLVFPEAAVGDWNEATELFWQETNEVLRRRSATVLIGATVRRSGAIRNVVMVRGAENKTFVQRVPVPIGMWNPLRRGGYELNLSGPGSIIVRGQRVALLICYEQLIAWTWISAMAETPRMIVAISNDTWIAGTPVGRYRSTVSQSWSNLFNLPLVRAVND